MTRRYLIAPYTLLSLLSACRVGPDYRAPADPAGAEAPLVSFNATIESPIQPPG